MARVRELAGAAQARDHAATAAGGEGAPTPRVAEVSSLNPAAQVGQNAPLRCCLDRQVIVVVRIDWGDRPKDLVAQSCQLARYGFPCGKGARREGTNIGKARGDRGADDLAKL